MRRKGLRQEMHSTNSHDSIVPVIRFGPFCLSLASGNEDELGKALSILLILLLFSSGAQKRALESASGVIIFWAFLHSHG